jgi:hypothetical protein
VGFRVNTSSEAGDDREVVLDQILHDAARPRARFVGGLASSYDRHTSRFNEIPPPLEIQQFDWMSRMSELLWVLARSMDPYGESRNASAPKKLKDTRSIVTGNLFGDEV